MPLIYLNDLIFDQLRFQIKYIARTMEKDILALSPEERNRLVVQQVLAAIGELHEFLEKGTNWKLHRSPHPIDREAAVEELVDAVKYVLNIFVYMPVSLEEFGKAWVAKSQVVHDRFDQEFPAGAARASVEPLNGGT